MQQLQKNYLLFFLINVIIHNVVGSENIHCLVLYPSRSIINISSWIINTIGFDQRSINMPYDVT